MSGKCQTIGDFTIPGCPKFCRLTWKLEIVDIPDHLGWTGTNLENRECFYFPDASQISVMVGDHSRQMETQICTVGDVTLNFAHYQSPKLLGSSPPTGDISRYFCCDTPFYPLSPFVNHASFNFWRTFHFRPNSSGESESDLWRLSDFSRTVGKK